MADKNRRRSVDDEGDRVKAVDGQLDAAGDGDVRDSDALADEALVDDALSSTTTTSDDNDGSDGRADGRSTGADRSSSTSAPARARTVVRSKTRDGTRSRGILSRLSRFVREIIGELQKVIWPTRKELLTYTTVVVVFVAVVMTFVALLDLGFARAMFIIFGSADTTTN